MISIFHGKNCSTSRGTPVCQAGYHPRKRTFKTHPKHVFFRYENRPYKYVFYMRFSYLSAMSFPKFVNMTKNTPFYFQVNRPYKYVLLHAFFLNLSVMSFPKFVNMTKNTPFYFQVLK